ncbi:MAG TPA: hypothetical protein PLB55_05470 [Prosthecobacter sp.]|nr:hypothetical protein [Prosthecobacter sp.]
MLFEGGHIWRAVPRGNKQVRVNDAIKANTDALLSIASGFGTVAAMHASDGSSNHSSQIIGINTFEIDWIFSVKHRDSVLNREAGDRF